MQLLLVLALAPLLQDPSPQEAETVQRVFGYELRRAPLLRGISLGTFAERSDDPYALATAVAADPDVPEWYRAEIDELAAVYRTLEALGPGERARVTAALSVSKNPRGDPAQHLVRLEEAAATLAEVFGDDHSLVAVRTSWMAAVLYQSGRHRESVERARQALALMEEREEERPAQVATLRGALGRSLWEAEYAEEALVELEAAQESWNRLGAARFHFFYTQRLNLMNDLGIVYARFDRWDEALALRREHAAYTRWNYTEESSQYALSLHNLASALRISGDFASAVTIQEQSVALELAVFGPSHLDVGYGWFNLGTYYLDLGRHAEAEEALQAAAAIFEPLSTHRNLATYAKARLAHLALVTGDPERAVALAGEAARDAERSMAETPIDRSNVLQGLGGCLIEAGELERASEVLAQSYALRRERFGKDDRIALQIESKLAVVQELAGEWEAAAASFERLAAEMERTEPAGSQDLTRTWVGLARSRFGLGDAEGARAAFRSAVESYERGRESVGPGLERSTFQDNPYPELAIVELELGRGEDAWRAFESWRARALYEMLASPRTESDRVLEEELASLDAQLAALEAERGGDPDAELEQRIAEVKSRTLELRAELGESSATAALEPLSLERVRAALADDEALVGWFQVGSDLFTWVVRPEAGLRWFRGERAAGGGRLTTRLADLAELFAAEARSPFAPRADAVAPDLRALGAGLLADVVAAGGLDGVAHLIVVPAEFDGFPIESLALGAQGLFDERWTFSYAPSASVHAFLSERAPTAVEEPMALVLGDPPFRADEEDLLADAGGRDGPLLRSARSFADLPALPGSRAEARAVAALFPRAELLLGPAASEAELDRLVASGALARFSVVHLASHALVDAERPERSGVVLSQAGLADPFEAALRGERVADGFLSSGEVAARWRLDAELVTLSGCGTALGRHVGGEGHIGLATTFLRAGARSLLVSLWEVNDEATMLLMRSFYEHWRNDGDLGPRPKAEALRRARRDLRAYSPDGTAQPYDHPAFWAAFVLIGDPR